MSETALPQGHLGTYNRNDLLDTYRNGSLSFTPIEDPQGKKSIQ
jgi:hypothetical protein